MNEPKPAGAGPAAGMPAAAESATGKPTRGTPAAPFSSYQKFVVAMLAFLQFTIVLDFMMLSPLGALVMPALNITPEGTDHLANNRAAAEEIWSQLALFGRKLAHMQQQYAEDEDVADNFGRGSRDSARGEWRQMKAEFLGLRDELKAAIYEKLNSSLEEKKRVLQILRRTIDEIRSK